MDNALAYLKKYGPPAGLGYAGVQVAQAITGGAGKITQVIVGALGCGLGVFLGMKFSA